MVTEFQQLRNFTNKCKKVQTSEFILSKNHSKNYLFRKIFRNFFVYLHEKHTKILDLNLEKQGRIIKTQNK